MVQHLPDEVGPVSYTHLRAHETRGNLVCRLLLEKKKFKILEAYSAEEAIDVCDNNNIHLILLDWMLPEMSGLSFLRTLKKQKSNSGIPIIFVTAREDEKDKIAGLNSGADDYITKPFSHLELLARVEAVLKRTYPHLYSDSLNYEDIKIDIKSHKVYRKDSLIKLSPKEYDCLLYTSPSPRDKRQSRMPSSA